MQSGQKMLALPEKGMAVSRTVHNVNLNHLCDWIEASLLFGDDNLSISDVIDILIEHQVYADQDFASERVAIAWGVLKRRYKTLGSPLGLRVSGSRLSKSGSWQSFPAYAFCMLLTCMTYLYPEAMKAHRSINAQGALFECLAVESLRAMFPGWNVRSVGWSPANPTKLKSNIDGIINDLREVAGSEIDLYVDEYANEIGLDVLAYLPYSDSHAALPVLMVQCASGADWIRKRHTPDMLKWEKIVNFSSRPIKGFVMPYAFAEQREFRKESVSVGGVFIDRYRLLAAGGGGICWTSSSLSADLTSFISPRVIDLPAAEEFA